MKFSFPALHAGSLRSPARSAGKEGKSKTTTTTNNRTKSTKFISGLDHDKAGFAAERFVSPLHKQTKPFQFNRFRPKRQTVEIETVRRISMRHRAEAG